MMTRWIVLGATVFALGGGFGLAQVSVTEPEAGTQKTGDTCTSCNARHKSLQLLQEARTGAGEQEKQDGTAALTEPAKETQDE